MKKRASSGERGCPYVLSQAARAVGSGVGAVVGGLVVGAVAEHGVDDVAAATG